MHVEPCIRGYRTDLTDDERVALVWALEAGRAVLLGDPDLQLLARETAVRPDLLDQLADRLFLAGCPATVDTVHVPPGAVGGTSFLMT